MRDATDLMMKAVTSFSRDSYIMPQPTDARLAPSQPIAGCRLTPLAPGPLRLTRLMIGRHAFNADAAPGTN